MAEDQCCAHILVCEDAAERLCFLSTFRYGFAAVLSRAGFRREILS
jgi:hypothetical protein